MGSLKTGTAMERITSALSSLTVEVKLHNSRGRTDINKDAEDFYCGLLNIILGKKLENLNLLDMNFPAIDLADRRGKLCVQVTSTNERDKIESTLEKFYDGKLDGVPLTERFNRLIVLIIGDKQKYRKPFEERDGFSFDTTDDIWDRKRLLKQIELLPRKKLQAVERYLAENLDHYTLAPPSINLPPQTALVNEAFVGRRNELREIGKQFEKQQFVTLSGLGGIGKTELAVQFAKKHWDGNSYYVRFVTDWRQTVLEHVAPKIQGLDQELEDSERIYQAAMQELEKCSEQDLLIVDNADQSKGTAELYMALSSLQMKILITTRVPVQGAILVEKMGNRDLYRIFKRHGTGLSNPEMDCLINAVKGHTMTVDLIARTLASPWCMVSVEKIRKAMEKSTMVEENTYPTIETDYYSSPEQPKIYGYLQALFRLQELSDAEKHILTCATLFPVNGISRDLLVQAIPERNRSVIESVSTRGWIQCENMLVTIHPVIRLVCRKELNATEAKCSDFLHGIEAQYDEGEYDWDKNTQMATIFTEASLVLEDPIGHWANQAGYLWLNVSEPQKALECSKHSVEKKEKCFPNSSDLAAAYSIVGGAYHELGNYKEALRYKLKELAISEQQFPKEHPYLADSYAELSYTYGELGKHEEELAYAQKALEIREKVCQKRDELDLKDQADLAASYNDVGGAYGNQGKYDDALKYQAKALQIRESILPKNHPDLATTYNDVGTTYGNQGKHAEALENKLKALKIREDVLQENHPDLARSHNSVAWTFYATGRIDDAARYMRRAADIICRTSLPEDHHDRVNYLQWANQLEAELKMKKVIPEKVHE